MDSTPVIECHCGGGFIGLLLFVVLLAMKLGGWVDISWWWVFAPLWVPLGILAGILGVVGLVAVVCTLIDRYDYWKRSRVK